MKWWWMSLWEGTNTRRQPTLDKRKHEASFISFWWGPITGQYHQELQGSWECDTYLLVPSTILSIHLEKIASNVSVTWAFCWRKRGDGKKIDELDLSDLNASNKSAGWKKFTMPHLFVNIRSRKKRYCEVNIHDRIMSVIKPTSICSCLESTNGPSWRGEKAKLENTHGVM